MNAMAAPAGLSESWRKLKRRLWMRYALREVSGADNHAQLDRIYSLEDPWNMDSAQEIARFQATNELIAQRFGQVGDLLEIGCGEGHQTRWLAKVSQRQYALDVSARAVERAQQRVPAAQFHVGDIFSQPWTPPGGRFDLVTACDVLYYLSDPAATLEQMRRIGRAGLVTFYAPACGRVAPAVQAIPGVHHDWFSHGHVAWLVAWWREA